MHPKSQLNLFICSTFLFLAGCLAEHTSGPQGVSPVYIVQQGDTLFEIAQKCSVALKELESDNPQIKNSDSILEPQRNTLPPGTKCGGKTNPAGRHTLEAEDPPPVNCSALGNAIAAIDASMAAWNKTADVPKIDLPEITTYYIPRLLDNITDYYDDYELLDYVTDDAELVEESSLVEPKANKQLAAE